MASSYLPNVPWGLERGVDDSCHRRTSSSHDDGSLGREKTSQRSNHSGRRHRYQDVAFKETRARQTEVKQFEVLLRKCPQVHYDPNPIVLFGQTMEVNSTQYPEHSERRPLDWITFGEGIDPSYGGLTSRRAQGKRDQVANLLAGITPYVREGDTIVEFCAGSGYVSLPMAAMFPNCTFVLLDMKQRSLDIAVHRIAQSGLENVTIFHGMIDDYVDAFDIGICLHGCGAATDMVLQKCILRQASYVVAPCCVGKIKHSSLRYPRSQALTQLVTSADYEILAKAADFGAHVDLSQVSSPHCKTVELSVTQKRRQCKTLIERDRNLQAEEAGYHSTLFIMHPPTATVKNDVLVGFHPNKFNTS